MRNAGRHGTAALSRLPKHTSASERSNLSLRVFLKMTLEAEFLFSISNDDTIEIKDGDRRNIVRIKKSAENKQIFYVPVNDAHTDADQMKLAIVKSRTPSTLKSLEPVKVVVDLLGRVHPAND